MFDDNECNKPWLNTDTKAQNMFWDRKAEWLPTWNGDDVAMQIDWIKVFPYDPQE